MATARVCGFQLEAFTLFLEMKMEQRNEPLAAWFIKPDLIIRCDLSEERSVALSIIDPATAADVGVRSSGWYYDHPTSDTTIELCFTSGANVFNAAAFGANCASLQQMLRVLAPGLNAAVAPESTGSRADVSSVED